ncbi:MAG: nitroreductase family protein [Planctomycetia bacterium]|nr:nitroreductase family protein [Planctomycetia bacterium]
MELFEAFQKRFSYRGDFADVPVPREDLIKIVEAGRIAPTACNCQLPTFVIVDDPALIEKIAALSPQKMFQTAKAVIACVSSAEAVFQGKSFYPEDCAAAVTQMLLAVTALGYASVWVQGFLKIGDNAEKIGEYLGVPASHKVQILLPLGVPLTEGGQPEKKPWAQRASFNRYEL